MLFITLSKLPQLPTTLYHAIEPQLRTIGPGDTESESLFARFKFPTNRASSVYQRRASVIPGVSLLTLRILDPPATQPHHLTADNHTRDTHTDPPLLPRSIQLAPR